MVPKKISAATPSVGSKKFIFDDTWAIDPLVNQNDIFICAQHALLNANTIELRSLQQSLPQITTAAHNPVSTGAQTNIVWATWHHGSNFYTYLCGDVTTILHSASLTDTEREKVLLRARKAQAQNMLVFATGAKLSSSIPQSLESGIEHIGLIFVHEA